MKFALALLFTLAFAMGVQSSILPWGAWGGHGWAGAGTWHGAGAWDGPWGGAWHGDDGDDGQWRGDWHGDDGQWHGDWGHGHGHAAIVAAHAPIVAVHGHAHEGSYIAKTRGAVHAAPLSGHIASAASINVQPAPGTI